MRGLADLSDLTFKGRLEIRAVHFAIAPGLLTPSLEPRSETRPGFQLYASEE